ncbi:MAG: histidine phosphatase family protein [Bacteroidales bacterium]|nr:histidine phosphatase family protein [Bacteroidales bacterium]
MKRTFIAIFLILFAVTIQAQEKSITSEVSTYYFIRHAEKVKIESSDPELSAEGKLRAVRWAEIFENISFETIYSTDYIRTRNTALPTAQSKGLELILYHPGKIDYEKFLSETKGKTVLVVGHSNTTPAFVNKLIGTEKYKLIDHDKYGNLYIVEITEGTVTNKLLYIN